MVVFLRMSSISRSWATGLDTFQPPTCSTCSSTLRLYRIWRARPARSDTPVGTARPSSSGWMMSLSWARIVVEAVYWRGMTSRPTTRVSSMIATKIAAMVTMRLRASLRSASSSSSGWKSSGLRACAAERMTGTGADIRTCAPEW